MKGIEKLITTKADLDKFIIKLRDNDPCDATVFESGIFRIKAKVSKESQLAVSNASKIVTIYNPSYLCVRVIGKARN